MRPLPPLLLAPLVGLALAAPLTAQYDDRAQGLLEPATATVTDDLADVVAAHLAFLASDELGGRETGTLEGDITARYVEAQFRRLGLRPAGDEGSYLQTYPLLRSRLLTEEVALELIGAEGAAPRAFALRDDFAVSGVDERGVDERFELAWVGWGFHDPAQGLDDYAGVDVEGKLALMYYGAPSGRNDLLALSRSTTKLETAVQRGARGVVFVMAGDDAGSARLMGFLGRRMGRSAVELDRDDDAPSTPRVYLAESAVVPIFAAAGRDWSAVHAADAARPGAAPGLALDGARLRLVAREEVERFEAANVAGLLPGHDPELAHEILVLSAHMDHEGRADDGRVYNGADDNASGTTAVLTAAERLARDGRGLGRSVLFLAVSGEEKGLLGSEWFVRHPTVPLEDIVGNINIDMVGRNAPDAVGATPSPEHPAFNSLAERAVGIGERVGLKVEWEAGEGEFRRRVDSYYARSDHMHFSEAGIPVVFFFSGEHADYHRTTDTLEKVDQRKVGRVVRLVEELVREVAADPAPPGAVDA